MKSDSEKSSRDDDLAFFGRVTASVSHELSNVISTIHQVSGLLEDLIAGSESGQPVPIESLERIHGRLSRQTTRGIGVIQNLNRFAHNVDERPIQFDVNRVVENLISVAGRFADLKRVHLQVEYSSDQLLVVNDPFRLQQIVFLALERALDTAAREDVVRISIQQVREEPTVSIVVPRPPAVEEKESRKDSLQALARELKSTISFRRKEGSEIIVLNISSG